MVLIYVLKCPISGEVRYVEKTNRVLKYRLKEHVSESLKGKVKGRRGTWIRSLCRKGLVPVIEIDTELAEGENWQEVEKDRILFYRQLSFALVNDTEGGDGVSSPSVEVRRAMSDSAKGRRYTEEGRKRASQRGWEQGKANLGSKRDNAAKLKMRLRKLGKVASSETKARMAVGQKQRRDREQLEKLLS